MAKGGKQTPLMTQYNAIKGAHQDAILFFRMGDFFEMFHDDAKLAAEELNIVLTARDKDSANPTPMAGVPHHSYQSYAARLLKKGYKVAICEQVSDPREAKGIVDREVTRVLTPGTVLDEALLTDGTHNYLGCFATDRDAGALALVDVSTGSALASLASGPDGLSRLAEEALRTRPAELLLPRDLEGHPEITRVLEGLQLAEGSVTWIEKPTRPGAAALRTFFGGSPPPSAGLDPALGKALSMLHGYLSRTHGEHFEYFAGLEIQAAESRMQLDAATVRNLELTETLMDREHQGSLLSVLDRCGTSMGSRLLRSWMLHPLCDLEVLEDRYAAVGALVRGLDARRELRAALKGVYDIPRCLGRIAARGTSPRDLMLLRASLEAFPALRSAADAAGLGGFARPLEGFEDLLELLRRAIVDSPPSSIGEGGVIREGYDADLDRIRSLSTDARDWIKELEASERARTGIKSLKIKFNKVMGYFLEVTRSNLGQVPDDYVRKQTLVNGERYVTEDLKRKESEVLGAEERSKALELDLFRDLRERVAERFPELQEAGGAAARLDVFCNLAEVAEERGFVRPELVDEPVFEVGEGRHPVVEVLASESGFVPNSLSLRPGDGTSLVLLTGPNMSGKSTFLRQTALIQLLAQMGSFVPAASARLGLCDRIFTRVGASDDLSRGESTFMVEMREAAFILNNVTPRSLVILDEIGRGTATYDGLSIAWAIVEHLARDHEGAAKVLFATHYHELTGLADSLPGIANLSVAVEEEGEDVVFLHQVIEGPASKSYGFHVARLAGFPEPVVRRARVLLEELERGSSGRTERATRRTRERPEPAPPPEPATGAPAAPAPARPRREDAGTQLTLFGAPDPVVEELRGVDVLNLTPIQALNELARLKAMVE